MLSKPEIAVLHVAKRALGLDEEAYRATLEHYGGTRSASSLNRRGFEAVMARFRHLGFVSDAHARNFGRRPGHASPGQVALIRDLWGQAMEQPTDAALNHWLERRFKISALRFLDERAAGKAITALRAMTARKTAKEAPTADDRPSA